MTTPWRPPASSSRDWRPDTDDRERFIEDQIALGCNDAGDCEAALRALRLVTLRCNPALLDAIDELLALAEDIADLDRQMGHGDAWRAAVDSYEAALTGLAHGATFVQETDVAMALPNGHGLTLVRR